MFDFEKLIIYDKAKLFNSDIRIFIQQTQLDRTTKDQLRRASFSIVLNIAEADGNDLGTSKARFASACGSAKEVRAGLQLAVAYGYVAGSTVAKVDIALDEVCAMSWKLSGR